jgi:zinc protease
VFDDALDIMTEVITEPAFETSEVDRLRDERLDEIAAGLDEPRMVAGLRANEAIFGGHPYGVRAGGVDETVRRIDSETLRAFHACRYRPNEGTLIIVGDLPDSKSTLGRWEGQGGERAVVGEAASLASRRIWAVDWPGPQSEIRIGDVAIARSDPDYAPAMIMNAILGGLFSSRINMNLREDKGWTYGAGSRVEARKLRGPFLVTTAVDSRASAGAVKEILGEMERMKSDPASEEEMELAINSLTLSLPRLFETVGQVSGRIAHLVLHSLPDDYWETYADMIRSVTCEDVQRIAERVLDTDRSAVVVVGPIEEFRSELESLGPVETRDIYGNLFDG